MAPDSPETPKERQRELAELLGRVERMPEYAAALNAYNSARPFVPAPQYVETKVAYATAANDR